MAQFRDSSQESERAREREQEQELVGEARPVDQSLVSETDDILDEIDSILEENAEEYVRGFVQKGGQ
ncbi:ubiquitin-like protein Pup [Rothia sp. AR01]|uniref:Prokaryotic ubiquitin-like protein Pup n=1 Tax=Rothia santali TaxID=2949643 RepID=A0A9X2HCY4_9MICC|nr:ubiquitin-like protein Pup [Rothia santali]MCP3424562.1 ubiquitin-like protein Pup [Rothia santali]